MSIGKKEISTFPDSSCHGKGVALAEEPRESVAVYYGAAEAGLVSLCHSHEQASRSQSKKIQYSFEHADEASQQPEQFQDNPKPNGK